MFVYEKNIYEKKKSLATFGQQQQKGFERDLGTWYSLYYWNFVKQPPALLIALYLLTMLYFLIAFHFLK